MVSLGTLWLPILLSAVLVFFISFVFHAVLPLHKNDFKKLPKEDAVIDALRPLAIPPGEYVVPHAASMSEARGAAHVEKATKGPVALLVVRPNGPPAMGKSLGQWFLYCVLVSFFAAYVTSHAVHFGGGYRSVFRFLGATAFMGYSLGIIPESIWFGRSWRTTLVGILEGLVYALFSAGIFGWLWPR